MPRSKRKSKPGKRGYRKNLIAPRKGCRPYPSCPRNKAKNTFRGEEQTVMESLPDTSESHPIVISAHRELGFKGFETLPSVQGIRLLALFDGIGTARLVLNELKVPITAYFSSEIHESANKVLKRHYSDDIQMLGCVRTIKGEKLASLGKIHLLMGGSPCGDLSLCNPKRRGLHNKDSSGRLFFEYHRILHHFREAALKNSHAFYWLYENTRAMETDNLEEISKYLGCKPVVICSSKDTAMARKRCYWGNLPGLDKTASEPASSPRPNLQDYILPYRKALVPRLPTLTGSSHSQLSGKTKKAPVSEDGKPSKLFIIEEENVFGFPFSYTDVHLTLTEREKLLGRSWCVPTITRLLEPFARLVEAGTLDL